MNSRYWVTCTVRLIGICLFLRLLSPILAIVLSILGGQYYYATSTFVSPYSVQLTPLNNLEMFLLFSLAPTVAGIAFSVYLMMGGRRFVNTIVPIAGTHCETCREPLDGVNTGMCPGCGKPITTEQTSSV